MPRKLGPLLWALLLALPQGASAQLEYNDPAAEPTDFARFGHWLPKDVYVQGDPIELDANNAASGPRVNFVSCPIFQDSKPAPLIFADFDGKRYFLRAQQNMTGYVAPPQLMHKVLVEGVVSKEPGPGGSIVLNPVHVSALPVIDKSCNTLLPDDGKSRIAFAKKPPGPGVSGAVQEGTHIRNTANSARLYSSYYIPDPVPDWTSKEFVVPYEFDSDRTFRGYGLVQEAVRRARNTNANRIEIIGERGSVLLTNGVRLDETPGIEKDRAAAVLRIMEDFPINGSFVVTTVSEPATPDGVNDHLNRRVRIVVHPGERSKGLPPVGTGTLARSDPPQ